MKPNSYPAAFMLCLMLFCSINSGQAHLRLSLQSPITLESFNVTLQKSNVVLTWKMVSELNSSSFILERSSDGNNFVTIGSLAASKDCIGVTEYTFVDEHPVCGNIFYRITLVNILDQARELAVRKLNVPFNNNVLVYPNPVTGSSIILQTGEIQNDKLQYAISDISGIPINCGTIVNYQQQIDISKLISGLYLIRLSNGSSVKFQKQ